ncbi:RNA degradosome polyphosphate kinase [Priestia megaterium]|jgi:polyphosphate kinase|uniref:RNA degradosome polyphosphate kinase n=1 Tax=Priestia megaterium TaxID=1404 RepID=UPI002B24571A|nr:RNA degradosome polyphosphate kinase [Priestia megaterium]MEB2265894.1 RNA degradosome polyphosphate kinase [Priestia megaterium]
MLESNRTYRQTIQVADSAYYNNRELSWLAFNKRVLEEAVDTKNPLLERFKFLGIFSSNLDEFFMIRVAGLKDQVKAGFSKPENKAGLTPKQQLFSISKQNHDLVKQQYDTYIHTLLPELQKYGVEIIAVEKLEKSNLDTLEQYFDEQIFPVLTPMAIDTYRSFPMLMNKSLNLAVVLSENLNDEQQIAEIKGRLAIVQVPSMLTRYIEIATSDSTRLFVLLEDVIAYFIKKLFKGYRVSSVSQFRITRNADMTIHEEDAQDLLKEIEEELQKRKWGAAVRLEIKSPYDQGVLAYLESVLEIDDEDVYEIEGQLDLTSLFSFYRLLKSTHEELAEKAFIPKLTIELHPDQNIFDQMIQRDILLHHPYESFKPVLDFVNGAADDENVLAIKQTLYRVSGDSPVIKALKRAAAKGKQVTVLVELKARFDEENNVQWAKELERAGCHVIYGMTHLKTHGKITLVVRREGEHIKRFVHLGTGNYNDATAKIYTDISLFTVNRNIGIDAANFFNYLSGYTQKPVYHHLSVAPFDIRNDFLHLIDQEIHYHRRYGNGRIIGKMNSLTDKILIMKLYEASIAGVTIELIVRGACCLRPQIQGVSENIRVRSIVGRFLEHSRIYYFHHNKQEKFFFSSADMMTRNMVKRVEILFPILDTYLKKKVWKWLEVMLADNVKAREQDQEGNYHYVIKKDHELSINSQEIFCQYALCDNQE